MPLAMSQLAVPAQPCECGGEISEPKFWDAGLQDPGGAMAVCNMRPPPEAVGKKLLLLDAHRDSQEKVLTGPVPMPEWQRSGSISVSRIDV